MLGEFTRAMKVITSMLTFKQDRKFRNTSTLLTFHFLYLDWELAGCVIISNKSPSLHSLVQSTTQKRIKLLKPINEINTRLSVNVLCNSNGNLSQTRKHCKRFRCQRNFFASPLHTSTPNFMLMTRSVYISCHWKQQRQDGKKSQFSLRFTHDSIIFPLSIVQKKARAIW